MKKRNRQDATVVNVRASVKRIEQHHRWLQRLDRQFKSLRTLIKQLAK